MSIEFDEYQKVGADFLASRRFALLADDMGLGKTAQAILAADKVGAQRVLVICPAVARVNWKREFYEFSIFDRDFSICFGASDWPTSNTIVSYDYATEHYSRLNEMSWDLIIIDESHFVKEPEAKRTVRIYGKDGLIRKTKRLWCLSGTPAPNHAGELWAMLFTFGVTSLSYQQWIDKFCNQRVRWIGRGKQVTQVFGTQSNKVPLLRSILSKVMLRRLKEDVLKDLPPISYMDYTVEESPLPVSFEYDKQKFLNEKRVVEESLSYTTTYEQSAMVLEGIAESVATLRRVNGLKKVQSVIELVTQELTDGAYEKIALFAWHREVIEALKEGLKEFQPAVINGAVSHNVRQKGIDSFQNDPQCRVFIGQVLSAGTAITLTSANQVGMVEWDWTPGNNAQAVMRCHRRGQKLPVFVRYFTLEDSVDQKIAKVYRRKSSELTQIFDIKGEQNEINN